MAVVLDASGTRALAKEMFAEIAQLDADVIAVDIPIGIPERERVADSLARAIVGGRASSVFTTPPRVALEAPTYAEALARAREATGKGISRQAYGLRHRIVEVDEIAQRDERVVEVHPEVCFAELAGRPLRHSKHTAEGLAERRSLLTHAGLHAPSAAGVPEADVVDATVAAWTARRCQAGTARPLPDSHRARIGAIWR